MKLGRRSTLLALGGLNAALAAAFFYLVFADLPDITPPQVRLAQRHRTAISVPPVVLPPLARFAEIGERPLFNPGRKPVASPAVTPTSNIPPDVTLVGIILDSQDRLALVRTPAQPFASALRLGATLSGWQLTEIAPDRIVLSAGAARDEIRLDANRAPNSPSSIPNGNDAGTASR
jgi:hypothetical protein